MKEEGTVMVDEANPVGQAGTLESCDCRVIVELTPNDQTAIEVEGPMKDVFCDAITNVAAQTLKRCGVTGANVKIMDRGALDYVIEARIEAAVSAAGGLKE